MNIVSHLFSLVAKNRSEEHTSELQSLTNLVCRLLLEKKKKKKNNRGEVAPNLLDMLSYVGRVVYLQNYVELRTKSSLMTEIRATGDRLVSVEVIVTSE